MATDKRAFEIWDRVEAQTTTTQNHGKAKLVQGARYQVIDLDERNTPFGNFVTYQLRGQDGETFWINNLHLLARKAVQS